MSISGIFPQDLSKPVIKTGLPTALERIEMTQQLVYSNRLIRDYLLAISAGATAEGQPDEFVNESQESGATESRESSYSGLQQWEPDDTEYTWVKAQDPIQQRHLCGLADKVVAEFVKDGIKEPAVIAEVVILGPVLDRDTYRSLLNSLIAKLTQDVYLNVPVLQGLIQLIEGASPGYLEHSDLIDTLTVLRKRLERSHKPSSNIKSASNDKSSTGESSSLEHTLYLEHKASFEHLYQITIAISRVLDVMVNSEVRNVDRTRVHQSLVEALSELQNIADPILQFQVHYALQASQYIPDDESIFQAVLRFSGGALMLTLGVAGICKLDPAKLFTSLDNLRQSAGEAYAVARQLPDGLAAFQQGRSGAAQKFFHGIRSGTEDEWYLTLLFARTYVRHGHLAKFNQTVCSARCSDNQAFQMGVCQILVEIAMDPLWDARTRKHSVAFLGALCGPTAGWKQHPAV
ncbi:hypothetical protein BGZ95_003327 [Linnemannia exigua]|uniref:Arm-like repeat domain-containing protein n=1 Tax=Linnemannia exigua TaxID=604196 RepID=A0AAD4D4E8_9FUNG|nr:hypothetical protein BGZ95_003327 [Linnemannia exigua]